MQLKTKSEHIPQLPLVHESRDVIELVGISPVYLNKFVERKKFGIAPRARPGAGRGTRRWFDPGDVYAIALVWWLFQSGLRSQVIGRVLQGIAPGKKANAYAAMVAVLRHYNKSGLGQVIAVTRDVRGKKVQQTTALLTRSEVEGSEAPGKTVIVIPTGQLIGPLIKKVPPGLEG